MRRPGTLSLIHIYPAALEGGDAGAALLQDLIVRHELQEGVDLLGTALSLIHILASLDQSVETSVDELADAAAQDSLFGEQAVQIGRAHV